MHLISKYPATLLVSTLGILFFVCVASTLLGFTGGVNTWFRCVLLTVLIAVGVSTGYRGVLRAFEGKASDHESACRIWTSYALWMVCSAVVLLGVDLLHYTALNL